MIALVLAVGVAAIGGSIHCAAMCGPLAAVAIGHGHGAPRAALAYAGGRLLAYAALGAAAGALGAGVDQLGALVSFSRLAMVASGVAMLAWGAWSFARALGWIHPTAGGGATRPMLHAIRRKRPAWRGALVGVLTAALPCGWLYAFVAVAAGTGTPLGGVAVMAAFWLGSTPATLGAGAVMRALRRRIGARAPLVTAALQLLVGVLVLSARVPMLARAPLAVPVHAASDAVPGAPSCH